MGLYSRVGGQEGGGRSHFPPCMAFGTKFSGKFSQVFEVTATL